MTIEAVRVILMWCCILNTALLILSFLICVSAGDWIYRMHSKWFPMPREAFNVALYSFLGLYKMFVWAFNLVPYIALLIAK